MHILTPLVLITSLVACSSKSEPKPAPVEKTGSNEVQVPVDAAEPDEDVSGCQLPAPQNAKAFGFERDVDGIGEQLLIPELVKICKEQKWSRTFADCLFLAKTTGERAECQKQLKPEVSTAFDARLATFVKKLDEWATKAPDCAATATAYYSEEAIASQRSVLTPADRARAMTEMKKLMTDGCKKWPKLLANCVRFNDQLGAVGERGADQCLDTAGVGLQYAGYPSGAVSLPTGVASCDKYLKLSKIAACADILSRMVMARSGLFEAGDEGEKTAADAACKEALAMAPKGCPAK